MKNVGIRNVTGAATDIGRWLAWAMVLVLAACSSGSPPPSRGRPAKQIDPVAMVAAVRAAGLHGHELEVQPLRDPQVEDLRVRAEALEAQGKHRQALAALDQALAITPDDPDLLQWKAELALLRRAWAEAEQLANRSFERGPKLGGLCRRNWTTIDQSRRGRGDANGAGLAQLQLEGFTVAPPVRM